MTYIVTVRRYERGRTFTGRHPTRPYIPDTRRCSGGFNLFLRVHERC